MNQPYPFKINGSFITYGFRGDDLCLVNKDGFELTVRRVGRERISTSSGRGVYKLYTPHNEMAYVGEVHERTMFVRVMNEHIKNLMRGHYSIGLLQQEFQLVKKMVIEISILENLTGPNSEIFDAERKWITLESSNVRTGNGYNINGGLTEDFSPMISPKDAPSGARTIRLASVNEVMRYYKEDGRTDFSAIEEMSEQQAQIFILLKTGVIKHWSEFFKNHTETEEERSTNRYVALNAINKIHERKPWTDVPGGYLAWSATNGAKQSVNKFQHVGPQLPELSVEDAASVKEIARRHATSQTTYKQYCIEFDAFWNARGVDWL